jgi:hypothetical protein
MQKDMKHPRVVEGDIAGSCVKREEQGAVGIVMIE